MVARLSTILLMLVAPLAHADDACRALLRGDSSARDRCSDVCVLFQTGDNTKADACANLTFAELRRDTYNSSISTLDGMGEPAVPALLKALASDLPLKRAGAADALGRMGMRLGLDKKAPIADALAAHAGDADKDVRLQVVGAIGRIGLKTPAAERAVRKAESDSDPVVRSLAAYASLQLKMTAPPPPD